MNFGLKIPELKPDQYKFGDAKLGDSPVNPTGQWETWLPVSENQNFGMEPMACTSFALTNCLEIMLKKEFGETENLSDRFLAYTSGTTLEGNDPHSVAEAFRKKGDVLQKDWDYDPSIVTWQQFYTPPPQYLYVRALEIVAEYAFGHSWVTDTSPESIKRALTYSPLTAGVYAWEWDSVNGVYKRPKGGQSGHDTVIYGYVDGQYWLVFDTYAPNKKRLAWDFGFDAVKRYTLNRQIVNETAWSQFVKWIRQFIWN